MDPGFYHCEVASRCVTSQSSSFYSNQMEKEKFVNALVKVEGHLDCEFKCLAHREHSIKMRHYSYYCE